MKRNHSTEQADDAMGTSQYSAKSLKQTEEVVTSTNHETPVSILGNEKEEKPQEQEEIVNKSITNGDGESLPGQTRSNV